MSKRCLNRGGKKKYVRANILNLNLHQSIAPEKGQLTCIPKHHVPITAN